MKFAYLIEPPFNYQTEDGAVTGCDVELARFVSQQLEMDEFDCIETEFAELLPGVASGAWDMTTGLFATVERKENALFSLPIWALPDGLLVRSGNPRGLVGYQSIAERDDIRLAVIRDQFQHRSAVEFGTREGNIMIFETYGEAAQAVMDGAADAYASVARAHIGFIEQNPDWGLESLPVPADEKAPEYGCFGFALGNEDLKLRVNGVLERFLGSPEHRTMMHWFGFSDAEVDAVARVK